MTAFYIAAAVGAVVVITYLGLALRSFLHVRRQVLNGIGDDLGNDQVFGSQGGRFSWKAGGGVLASMAILSALALGPAIWYLVPFLAIGSAVAVVVAFILD